MSFAVRPLGHCFTVAQQLISGPILQNDMSEWLKSEKKWDFIEQHQYLAGFCSEFVDADLEGLKDKEVAARFVFEVRPSDTKQVIDEARGLLASSDFPWREVGACANRYFECPFQCREWLEMMLIELENSTDRAFPTNKPL